MTPSKSKLAKMLMTIADTGDKEDTVKVNAIKQLCLMFGYNEQTEAQIDFSKLKINFGKKSKK